MVSFLMKPASRRETFPPIGGFRVVADAAGGWKPNFSFALIAAKKYREHGSVVASAGSERSNRRP